MEAESQKAFEELKKRMFEATSKLRQTQAQIVVANRSIKKAVLTGQELQQVPENTRTYHSLGKMFVLEPRNDLLIEQAGMVREVEQDLEKLKKAQEYHEKELKEVESAFKELLSSSPALAREILAAQG